MKTQSQSQIDVFYNTTSYTHNDMVDVFIRLGYNQQIFTIPTASPLVSMISLVFEDDDHAIDFVDRFYESLFSSIGDGDIDLLHIPIRSNSTLVMLKIASLHSYAVGRLVTVHDEEMAALNQRISAIEACIESGAFHKMRPIVDGLLTDLADAGIIEYQPDLVFPTTH